MERYEAIVGDAFKADPPRTLRRRPPPQPQPLLRRCNLRVAAPAHSCGAPTRWPAKWPRCGGRIHPQRRSRHASRGCHLRAQDARQRPRRRATCRPSRSVSARRRGYAPRGHDWDILTKAPSSGAGVVRRLSSAEVEDAARQPVRWRSSSPARSIEEERVECWGAASRPNLLLTRNAFSRWVWPSFLATLAGALSRWRLLELLHHFEDGLAVLGSIDLRILVGDLPGLVNHEGPA